MKNRKPPKAEMIITGIILIIVFPVLLYATYSKFILKINPQQEGAIPNNPRHEFKKDGFLFFYENDKLLGTYECQNPNEYCDYAYETIDDSNYNNEYYDDNSVDKINLVNNRYVFITDVKNEINDGNQIIYLYDLNTSKKVATYHGIKDYTIGIANNNYIVKNKNNKWGVINLNNDYRKIIDLDYDFIGLNNQKDQNSLLDSEVFIAKKNDKWMLLNNSGEKLTTEFVGEITDFNGKIVIIKKSNRYMAMNYNGTPQLDSDFAYANITEKYLNIVDENNTLIVETLDEEIISSKELQLYYTDYRNEKAFTSVIDNNKLIITIKTPNGDSKTELDIE